MTKTWHTYIRTCSFILTFLISDIQTDYYCLIGLHTSNIVKQIENLYALKNGENGEVFPQSRLSCCLSWYKLFSLNIWLHIIKPIIIVSQFKQLSGDFQQATSIGILAKERTMIARHYIGYPMFLHIQFVPNCSPNGDIISDT